MKATEIVTTITVAGLRQALTILIRDCKDKCTQVGYTPEN